MGSRIEHSAGSRFLDSLLPCRLHRPLRPADLVEQLANGGVELRAHAPIALADRARYGYIDRTRVHLHLLAFVVLDADKGRAHGGAEDQLDAAGVDDPAGGRLTDDLAHPESAVALGEVLGVGERVLVGNQKNVVFAA